MMIYVMALYTFYALTMSIVDIVKYRKMGSPVMSTAKIVSLSAALVSLLNLETAMLAQIGAALGSLAMVIGILVGIVGMVLVALAYPLYNRVLKKQRKKSLRRSCDCPMNC